MSVRSLSAESQSGRTPAERNARTCQNSRVTNPYLYAINNQKKNIFYDVNEIGRPLLIFTPTPHLNKVNGVHFFILCGWTRLRGQN